MEQLYDLLGQRKYLTQHERDRFLKAAQSASTPVRAVSEILVYTGCRISGALALTTDRIDSAAGVALVADDCLATSACSDASRRR